MNTSARLTAWGSLVLFGLAVLAFAGPTPTPEGPGKGDQPNPPKGRGATSQPGILIIGEEGLAPGIIMMGDDVEGLPTGLKVPSYDKINKVFEYLKPNPDQQKLWVQFQKQEADKAIKTMPSLHCTLVESDHYLIYTNWPAGDQKFLKDNLEGLYSTFIKLFNIDQSDTSKFFLGKMPVYCVETKEEFGRLSLKGFNNPVSEGVLGYCQSNSWGLVKLVLYRTESYRGKSQLVRWGEVMSHEGTHAFVARYRSNRRIPAWMNEGLAEYVSCELMRQFRGRNITEKSEKIRESISGAQKAVYAGRNLSQSLFEVDHSPQAEMYPVAWSLTKMLIKQNNKAYVQTIIDIKDGMDGEKALEKNFKCNYAKLEEAWKKWVVSPAGKQALEN